MRKNTLTTSHSAALHKDTEVIRVRTLVVTLAAVVAFGITAPVAAPQQADPNENASCIAHLIELGTAGSFRSEVHGPLGVPFGREVISHFAVVHEGESAEECLTEQN